MMHPAASMVIYTTVWIAKVAGAAAFRACSANGADVRSVAVNQHLHAVTFTLNHNQMTRAVQRSTKMLAKSAQKTRSQDLWAGTGYKSPRWIFVTF
jgi:hypothetical protein